MLGTILAPAAGCESAPLISVVVERDHGHGFADDERVAWRLDTVPKRLEERPELLVVAVGIDHDLRDQAIQIGQIPVAVVVTILHHALRSRPRRSTPRGRRSISFSWACAARRQRIFSPTAPPQQGFFLLPARKLINDKASAEAQTLAAPDHR